MREIVKMIVVLTMLATFSGSLLAAIHSKTKDRIVIQILKFVKGPAIRKIFKEASNDPIVDRFDIKDGDETRSFFVGVFEGEPRAVAFETFGKGGYGGEVGLMVGIDVKEDKLVGVGVTTHAETPGMGARAQTDPSFVAQFEDLSLEDPFKVTQDGGSINALSGATLTSRAVSSAATEASTIYKKLKPQIEAKLKDFNK
ncbi:MAG: RnfABCDGE type electron transport complex subunit G [Desulfobacterales bacterium]|nr:RnfABCDGE type electron transport complex subunit G [Desulfobacterales bacterium]